jgi:hypothetical protein
MLVVPHLSYWSSQPLVDTAALGLVSGLELLWTDAAEIAVPQRPDVEVFDVRCDVRKGELTARIDVLLNALLLETTEEDSATSSSQHLPLRLMLSSSWFARQKRRHESLPYCTPRSE